MALQASVDNTQETRDRRPFVIDAPEEADTSQVRWTYLRNREITMFLVDTPKQLQGNPR